MPGRSALLICFVCFFPAFTCYLLCGLSFLAHLLLVKDIALDEAQSPTTPHCLFYWSSDPFGIPVTGVYLGGDHTAVLASGLLFMFGANSPPVIPVKTQTTSITSCFEKMETKFKQFVFHNKSIIWLSDLSIKKFSHVSFLPSVSLYFTGDAPPSVRTTRSGRHRPPGHPKPGGRPDPLQPTHHYVCCPRPLPLRLPHNGLARVGSVNDVSEGCLRFDHTYRAVACAECSFSFDKPAFFNTSKQLYVNVALSSLLSNGTKSVTCILGWSICYINCLK